MKKLFISAIWLTLLAGSAFAADLPSRKEPIPPPPLPMWTGFYAGLNAGGVFGGSNSVSNTGFPLGGTIGDVYNTSLTGNYYTGSSHLLASAASLTGATNVNGAGFIGGGQIGYNWQIPFGAAAFITGIEADIQGSTLASTGSRIGAGATSYNYGEDYDHTDAAITGIQNNKALNWIGTVRGRVGYLVSQTLLVYGTGGLAYGGVSARTASAQFWTGNDLDNDNDCFGCIITSTGSYGSYSTTLVGWTAGGGLEWMFSPNWSLKAEYLYYDLGNGNWNNSPAVSSLSSALLAPINGTGYFTGIAGSNSQTRFNGNIVRAGVNYHFNWATTPVVAKY